MLGQSETKPEPGLQSRWHQSSQAQFGPVHWFLLDPLEPPTGCKPTLSPGVTLPRHWFISLFVWFIDTKTLLWPMSSELFILQGAGLESVRIIWSSGEMRLWLHQNPESQDARVRETERGHQVTHTHTHTHTHTVIYAFPRRAHNGQTLHASNVWQKTRTRIHLQVY